MNFFHVLFSFRGRSGRLQFRLLSISELAVFTAGVYFLGGLLANTGLFELSESVLPKVVAACTLAIAALIASMAIAVRRLHDRNKSAWWLLPFFFLPVLVEVPAGFFGVTEGA